MNRTIRRLLFLALACPAFAAASAEAPGGTPCDKLKALTIPDVAIVASTSVAPGGFTPPAARAALDTGAFCRVQAEAHPTPDSQIRIEVWLPSPETWNGRFEGVGNGGYQGNFPYPAMATALRQGYAVAATDTGHTGDDLKFGENHPEKVIDWSYRAIHVTAENGKIIVRNYFGRFADRSYFVGCSTGGHQALSEAQRFPEDYDGIVAGDPAYDRVHQTAAYLWSWMATHDDSGASLLPPAQMKLVTRSAIQACDAADGIKDGIIADPRKCKFDPAQLLCKSGQTGDSCLNPQQVAALQKVYAGTHNPKTGAEIFPGWSLGTESFGDAAGQGWGAYILDPKEPMRIDVFRYFAFNDPNWSWRTFDFNKDVDFVDAKIGYMAAVNADLTPFRARGGKLLMYTGWEDPVAAPLDVLKYYDLATQTMGGLEKTKEFFRFFMVPGMGHCGGGPGPNTFDALASLRTWVEDDKAPALIVASHLTDGKVDRSRPLCNYPEIAHWKGSGSTDDAANFVCQRER
jgi:feruloyl esterase